MFVQNFCWKVTVTWLRHPGSEFHSRSHLQRASTQRSITFRTTWPRNGGTMAILLSISGVSIMIEVRNSRGLTVQSVVISQRNFHKNGAKHRKFSLSGGKFWKYVREVLFLCGIREKNADDVWEKWPSTTNRNFEQFLTLSTTAQSTRANHSSWLQKTILFASYCFQEVNRPF